MTWDTVTWIHPVQQVSHGEAERVLARHRMALPTMAQWLRAASGSSAVAPDFAWFVAAPLQFANLPGRDDGFEGSAPAGSFSANGFGLHDVFGNVAEFCADGFVEQTPGAEVLALFPHMKVADAAASKRVYAFGGSHRDWMGRNGPLEYTAPPIQNIFFTVGVRPVFVFP